MVLQNEGQAVQEKQQLTGLNRILMQIRQSLFSNITYIINNYRKIYYLLSLLTRVRSKERKKEGKINLLQ